VPSSIFLDFTLPNSATWFYLSLGLCVAVFVRFDRPLTLRNFDLLALYLFVPGFLLVQEANAVGAAGERLAGYVWLLAASLAWFVRCLVDLAVSRRSPVRPNLVPAGLGWSAVCLFACLTAVAFARPSDPWEPIGKRPAALSGVEDTTTAVVARAAPPADARFWVKRSLGVAGHLSVTLGLLAVGWRVFRDPATGLAAATLYLLLPYTAFHVGQVHHVLPAALLVWAVAAYRSPEVAGALVGLAAGTAFFPVLLLPAWGQFYRGRGLGRFLLGAVVAGLVGLAVTAGVLWADGRFPDGVYRTLNLADWQPWKVPTAESAWTGAHWAYRLPVFVAFAGFVLVNVVWPPARNLGQLIATSAAVLIGVQFWFADRGGLYVLWYAPLLVLVVLRPNLIDAVPSRPDGPPGWMRAVLRRVWRTADPPLSVPSSLARPGGLARPDRGGYSPAGGPVF
jgi:hypothetical protein